MMSQKKIRPKRVGIVSKCSSTPILNITRDIINLLSGCVDIAGDSLTAQKFNLDAKNVDAMDVDLIICIGGDGTILRTLQALEKEVPVLGINMGATGFLADAMPENAMQIVKKSLAGFEVEKRMRLTVSLDDEDLPCATNEAVLLTSRPAKMLHFRVFVDGDELATLRADGIVFATPTGSTAYAMSAGGPIVDPRVEGIIIVPLAPFTLVARPSVVHASSRIKTELLNEKDATVVIDGQFSKKLKEGDSIFVTRADTSAAFVKTGSTFFSKVRSKLKG